MGRELLPYYDTYTLCSIGDNYMATLKVLRLPYPLKQCYNNAVQYISFEFIGITFKILFFFEISYEYRQAATDNCALLPKFPRISLLRLLQNKTEKTLTAT